MVMRTTVDIPDPLYRQLKAKAALKGCSVKELILKGVETELQCPASKKGRRVKLPIFDSKHPGSLKLTNRQINEILFP
jgi:hypothetical protein